MEQPSVLVVEDRPSVLNLMVTILEGAFQVTRATDGATAMALIGSEVFDVVLTDVRLPGATGFEVLREVQMVSPRTSVVMMTAYANVSDAVEAMRLGAYDYVAKPLDADEVKLVVARAADSARSCSAAAVAASTGAGDAAQPGADPSRDLSLGFHRAIEEARVRASRAYLVDLLRLSGGNVTRAATRAGMTRESLHRVMRKYGVQAARPVYPGVFEEEAGQHDLSGADKAYPGGVNRALSGRSAVAPERTSHGS